MKWYKIKDNETLELFIVSSDEQPINSVLVTDKNSTFVKPIANSIDFTEVVEGATKEEIAEMGGSGKSLNQIMKEKKVLNMDELMKLHGDA